MSRNLNAVNLLHFAAFRAVMLTGTVSGAAEILGRSQPAVSRILDRLEYDLGLTLFDRRKGLVTPTPEAHLLLEEVERAYIALDSLRTASARIAGGEDSSIHIATLPTLGTNFLPDVVADFAAEAPSVKVTFHVRMSVTVEEWAAARKIDFGLAERPLHRTGFSNELFSDAPYVAAVPRGHPLGTRAALTPEDLLEGPFISWTNTVPVRTLLDQALQSYGLRVNAAYETNLSVPALNLVKRGLGVAIIDPFTAIRLADETVRLLPFIPKIPFNVALLIPDNRPPSSATQHFLQMMREARDRVLQRLP